MFNKDEGKIECLVGNQGDMFLAGQEAEIVLILFLCHDSLYLFVSGSWYCQIQTTRLNVFFKDKVWTLICFSGESQK